jgi:hypothetical protein
MANQQQNVQPAQQQNNQQQQQQVQQPIIQPAVQQLVVNPVNQAANNVSIVHAQVIHGTNGGMALKVQRTKLPEFWGQKDKDFITANEFVKQVKWVDKIKSANNWSDKIAFKNFALALRGSANTWLDSLIMLKKII